MEHRHMDDRTNAERRKPEAGSAWPAADRLTNTNNERP